MTEQKKNAIISYFVIFSTSVLDRKNGNNYCSSTAVLGHLPSILIHPSFETVITIAFD